MEWVMKEEEEANGWIKMKSRPIRFMYIPTGTADANATASSTLNPTPYYILDTVVRTQARTVG